MQLRTPIRYLNIGGGFGIPYFEGDRPLDLAAIGDNLAGLMADAIGPNLPDARVVVELGRYIVGECGVYVTRVVDRKESRGKTFLVVDGGLHHQLAASGNFGQVIRRNYPVAIGDRPSTSATEIVSVVGCLCTPLDLLADDVVPPKGRDRRPGRGLPGGRLRAHREPDRLPQPPIARRGARLAMESRSSSSWLAVLVGLPGLAAAGASRSAGAGLARLPRPLGPGPAEELRFLVLIPAHNEERVIGRVPRGDQRRRARPSDMVLVVADRCTDATAEIARAGSARRCSSAAPTRSPAGPPRARPAWSTRAALEWDAVVMLDADSVIAPGFFAACERALAAGADAGAGPQREQARPDAGRPRPRSPRSRCRAITMPRGRDRLGLVGAAARHRHGDPSRRRPRRTVPRARLRGPRLHARPAPGRESAAGTSTAPACAPRARARWSTFGGQKVRYEAGRMAAARAYVPRLLKRAITHRDAACLEAAWFLATPPFALAVLSLAGRDRRSPRSPRPGRWRRSSAPACSRSPSSSSPA